MKAYYKIRDAVRRSSDGKVTYWTITVPREIVEVVPDNARFTPELTEEGILYRISTPPQLQPLPAWAREEKS